MTDDVVLNKAAGIERCLLRIVEEYGGGDREKSCAKQTKQDTSSNNHQRACETASDLPM